MKELIKKILKYPVILLNKIFLYFYYEFSNKNFYAKNEMFQNKDQRILIISPHVDDETIGLGSTILKHKKHGDYISCVYITDGGGATSDLSKEELISQRRSEANKLKDAAGIDTLRFIDIPDGYVKVEPDYINKLLKVIREEEPDIIYSPFLLDGHTDHVNSSRLLLKALKLWNKDFSQIYLYEVNTRINPKYINSIVPMTQEDFEDKNSLYKVFKSQYVMGFDAFQAVDKAKRLISEDAFAVESFIKVNVKQLQTINDYLNDNNFNPEDFRQLSSRYNLIFSYRTNKDLKESYLEGMGKLL